MIYILLIGFIYELPKIILLCIYRESYFRKLDIGAAYVGGNNYYFVNGNRNRFGNQGQNIG